MTPADRTPAAADGCVSERAERDAQPLGCGRDPSAVPLGVEDAAAREDRQKRRPRSGLSTLVAGSRLGDEAHPAAVIP